MRSGWLPVLVMFRSAKHTRMCSFYASRLKQGTLKEVDPQEEPQQPQDHSSTFIQLDLLRQVCHPPWILTSALLTDWRVPSLDF